jgi:hypothetical protein
MSPAKRHMGKVASAGCVVGNRGLDSCGGVVEVHHVAEGSGKRSDFSTVGLCTKHHDGQKAGSGFHGMGTERFCKLFRVPGESEYGLLVWANEDIAKLREFA